MNIIGVTSYYLIGLVHEVEPSKDHEPVARDVMGPRGESGTSILLK